MMRHRRREDAPVTPMWVQLGFIFGCLDIAIWLAVWAVTIVQGWGSSR